MKFLLLPRQLFFILTYSLILIPSAFSQTDTELKPTLQNFGSSLKKIDKNQKRGGELNKNFEESDNEVIRVETNLVVSEALVIDNKGKAVSGLKKEDFLVTENGIPQEIGLFSLGDNTEVSRSIVLIIDYSGSQIPYIKTSVDAAKVLVDRLNPKDRMAIVTDDVELLVAPTRDKTLLKAKLDSLMDNVKNGKFVDGEFIGGRLGKSLQYSALLASINELFDDEDVRPIVILQSDGDQYFNIKSARPKPFDSNTSYEPDFMIEDLFEKIENSRVTIYSVISGLSLLGVSQDERFQKMIDYTEPLWRENKIWKPETVNFKRYVERINLEQESMNQIAQMSGGFADNLAVPEQADEIYSRIFYGISKRYLIGFYPPNLESNPGRRNVKIEVRGHPEYVIMGRKSYSINKK